MDHYIYEEDGKLHTRYSELKGCTPGGVQGVIEKRKLSVQRGTAETEFGTARHQVFTDFLVKNGKIPKIVKLDLEVAKDCVEQSYDIEVWPGIIIHFTPDFHNTTYVADFKTTGKGAKGYTSDKQVIFYAWMLNKLGHKVTKGYYICEVWDKERTEIKGYEILVRNITPRDIEAIEDWAKERATCLQQAIAQELA